MSTSSRIIYILLVGLRKENNSEESHYYAKFCNEKFFTNVYNAPLMDSLCNVPPSRSRGAVANRHGGE
jgi:hypothetical protein